MPVEPIPCAPGEGGGGEPAPSCCAPSIASAPLCLSDGTTILAVVQSGCVECGQTAEDPTVIGWLDTTGMFTAGALPPDAGPCDTGCVDTVCRTLCDDTDGDGQADATYSELWCIRANGVAELVLTYQDDPSQEYVPASPVDCEYGCPETETVQLCDDSGPFLRRYTFLAGTATFEDVALDGQTPHIVTGTVRTCSGQTPCEQQTTPAATLGLCLADGTPIAVIVTRDCDGTVTRDGWLNLTSGTYSVGEPPAGTIACGDSRSIQVSGTFCDIDPDSGDVLGLVLVEYSYAADGAIDSVRLVDAVTGDTYTPQGEVTTCPAGVEQPERDLLQLCDTADDGTVTPILRDFARDENGAITGHTDYLLDGTPYTPTGTVGVCPAESACWDCTTQILCDTDAMPPATIAGTAASGTLPNGVAWTATGPSPLPPNQQGDGAAWWGTGLFPNPSIPVTTFTFDQPVTAEFSVMMVHSTGTGPGENTAQLPVGAQPLSLPPGYTYDRSTGILSVDATLTDCTTLDAPTRETSARFRVTGVSSFALQYLGTRTVLADCRRIGTWLFGAVDASLGGEFARTVCRDCSGEVTAVADTLLDGRTAYTPVGTVGVCQPPAPPEPEPCRNTSTVLLCDLPTGGSPETAVTDTSPVPYTTLPGVEPLAGGAAALWSGGPLTIPADTSGALDGSPQRARSFAATIQAPRPGCDTGTATVTATMTAERTGPDAACLGSGYVWLLSDGARVAATATTASAPVGNVDVLTVTAQVPAADLAAGNVVLTGALETYQAGASGCPSGSGTGGARIGGWNLSGFEATVTYDQTGCETQILRTVTVDCETGAVIATADTTLDGQPYTVTGEVGQCTATGGGECCPPEARVDVETGLLCLVDASGDVIGRVLVERVYDDQSGERIAQRYVDPVTGDPVEVQAGVSVAVCPPEPCRDTYTTQVCDLPVGDPAGIPSATNVSATAYPWDGDQIRCVNQHPGGGQALWDGGTVTIPARASGAGSCTPNQWLTGVAARLQAERPSCDSGTVTITVAVAARNNGPSATAVNYAGSIRLHRTDTGARLANSGTDTLRSMPAGTVRTMTTTAVGVPAALLAAGQIVVALDVEAWDQTGNTGSAWLLSNFTASYEFQQDGCETQFIRKIVTDCETGETISVTDTTLGGDPYTVTGEVGECTTLGGGEGGGCCPDTEAVTLCNTGVDGVVTPFLRHLTYPEGSGTPTVRDTLLDGTEYVPDGEVGVCQSEQSEPTPDVEVVQLCDLVDGADPMPFLRHLVYLPGATTPTVVDTSLDGVTPYTPAGTVGVCESAPEAEEPCRDTTSTLLCDTSTEVTWRQVGVAPDPASPAGQGFIYSLSPTDDSSTVGTIRVTVDRPQGGVGCIPPYWGSGAVFTYELDDVARGMDTLRVNLGDFDTNETVTMLDGSPNRLGGNAYAAGSGVIRSSTDNQTGYMFFDRPPAGLSYRFTGACIALSFDAVSTRTVQFMRRQVVDCETGQVVSTTDTTLDGQPYAPTGFVGQCEPVTECCPAVNTDVLTLCDTADDGTVTTFLRHLTYTEDAAAPEVRDTGLDGVTPYTPAGEVGVCQLTTEPEPEPCRNSSTVLLCDLDTALDPGDTTFEDHAQELNSWPGWARLPGGGGSLWSGGSVEFPAESNGNAGNGSETHRWVAARITSPAPACDDGTGTARVTVRLDARVDGPANACGAFGSARLLAGDGTAYVTTGQGLGKSSEPAFTVGTTIPVTVTATVPSSELAAGDVYVWLNLRTYRQSQAGFSHCFAGSEGPIKWTVSGFSVGIEQQFGDDCATQFLRNITVDCETGEVVATTDTTLDGAPYTVTGKVGQCAAAGGECCPPPAPVDCPAHTVIEACRCDDTDGDGVADVDYVELLGVDCDGQLTSLGTYTPDLAEPYSPVSPVACNTGGERDAEPAFGVQARRVELAAGETWDASAWPTLQSVTAVTHGGTGTVTTTDGASTLYTGEAATWSVGRDTDAALTGPLTITADTGTVTLSYTIGVTL
ncbi:hypothetical protein DIZ27_32820 [Streptomyces sp. NWU339]|uniref:hypothetical protein n=1 Tax=Streptomyces sp. NWU339 TaxID=2185284 RepID=UPI000D672009|nr:hypothetical protein [Streptomyces sp. NWU339]PWI06526.1 hypothetical protein DIZ27_32820 [Streptomyces sp. NWU339]